MVVTAVLQSFGVEDQWGTDGRRYFGARFQPAAAYNTTPVIAYWPQQLFDLAKDLNVRITQLFTVHAATIGVQITPFFGSVAGQMYIEPHTTTAAMDYFTWRQLDIPLGTPASINTYLVQLTMAGYGVADIIQLGVVGYLASTAREPQMQSVSLEGYKWPLTRR